MTAKKPILMKVTSEQYVWIDEKDEAVFLADKSAWGYGEQNVRHCNMKVERVKTFCSLGEFDTNNYKLGDAVVVPVVISKKDTLTSVNVTRKTETTQKILLETSIPQE